MVNIARDALKWRYIFPRSSPKINVCTPCACHFAISSSSRGNAQKCFIAKWQAQGVQTFILGDDRGKIYRHLSASLATSKQKGDED
jgi:hypothetical protein